MTTLEIARGYVRAGLSVIPVKPDGSKAPSLNKWAPFQQRLPTDAELAEWFGQPDYEPGIAILCGKVSGNLLVLDFESSEAYDEWLLTAKGIAKQYDIDLFSLPIVSTPSGGVHVYYRSLFPVPGNKKLAMDDNGETIIETRGEGGYVVAPGSPSECHETGKLYSWVSRGWLNG